MAKDTKIAIISFLAYGLFGLWTYFGDEESFVLPFPLIGLLIPLLSLVYLVMSIKKWNAIFFACFLCQPIAAFSDIMGLGTYEWLYWLGLSAPAIHLISIMELTKKNGLAIACGLAYLFNAVALVVIPDYFLLSIQVLSFFTLVTLILQSRKLEPVLKRQFLLLCFSSTIVAFTQILLTI